MPKPDAANPAIALCLTIEDQWRRVADLGLSRCLVMTGLGYILFIVGFIAGIAGDVRFMVVTYRHGLGWFFTCLFLPVISWIFFLIYFKEAWRPVALSTAGFAVAFTGYYVGGFGFLS